MTIDFLDSALKYSVEPNKCLPCRQLSIKIQEKVKSPLSLTLLLSRINLNMQNFHRIIFFNKKILKEKSQNHLRRLFTVHFYWLCFLSRIQMLRHASMINCRVSSWILHILMHMSGRPSSKQKMTGTFTKEVTWPLLRRLKQHFQELLSDHKHSLANSILSTTFSFGSKY